MNNSFFMLPSSEQIALIEKTAAEHRIPSSMVEKDIWICWLLGNLFSMPVNMSFKGGTSLSKIFGLINRFSEDCDITIDYRHFYPEFDIINATRSQLKKISDNLKSKLREFICGNVRPFLQSKINELPSAGDFSLVLSDTGEDLRFYYPTLIANVLLTEEGHAISTEQGGAIYTENNARYLRDHVLIEFGARNSTEPCVKHQIAPYIANSSALGVAMPVGTVNVLSPLRTYFEKATLIHIECQKENTKPTPDRYARHWYDLFMLSHSKIGEAAFANLGILKSVVEIKNAFFHYSYASYEDCLSGKLKLVPKAAYIKSLKKDYDGMISAGMFIDEPPLFEDIIDSLAKLEESLNEKISVYFR